MQKLIITGNLGRDPEMRYTATGRAVTNFSVATTRRYTRDGHSHEETTWFRVAAWGGDKGEGLAGICNKYLQRGSKVMVIGELKPEITTYQNKANQWVASYEVTAREVEFLGGGNGQSASSDQDYTPSNDIDEDEIPF